MNIPNKLTVFRVILIPVFIFLYLFDETWSAFAALFVFILAALTDWYDGYLARKNHQVTTFGKIVDPLADKILNMAAFICFVQKGVPYVNAAVVVLILARELVVTGLRLIAMGENVVIAASIWGKTKTVTQFILIIGVLLFEIIEKFFPQTTAVFNIIILIMVIVSVAAAIISGVDYIVKNHHLLTFK